MLGAAEVGMARALLEAGARPDLVCGTSVGAINGAAIAADPTPEGAQQLLEMWDALGRNDMLGGSLVGRLASLVSRRTALHGNGALRQTLRDRLPARTFEDLAVPFECAAASIERAREHWFHSGELIEPVIASCAAPGHSPPVRRVRSAEPRILRSASAPQSPQRSARPARLAMRVAGSRSRTGTKRDQLWRAAMSGTDKAKNKMQNVSGKAKETIGKVTGDRDTQSKGKGDQAKSKLKDAGEKVKDAFKK